MILPPCLIVYITMVSSWVLWFLHQYLRQLDPSISMHPPSSLLSFGTSAQIHPWSLPGLALTHSVLAKGVCTFVDSSSHLACLLYTLRNCPLMSAQYFLQLLCYNLLIYSLVVGV